VTTLLERTTRPQTTDGRSQYRLPVVPRGRRPVVTVASALLVLASIAIFASIYSSAGRRVPVLVVTSTIQQGQRIVSADLGTAQVASSGGLATIPVSSADELSGTWAAVTVPAGSLLTRGDVTAHRPVSGGNAVVGLALKDGQLPSTGLVPGDEVMVVQTLGAGTVLPLAGTGGDGTTVNAGAGAAEGSNVGAPSSTGVLVGQATIFQTAVPSATSPSGASELVSVEVPSTLAAAVATAAAASQVSLVLLPAGAQGTDGGSGS
jgi:hypothetical protein